MSSGRLPLWKVKEPGQQPTYPELPAILALDSKYQDVHGCNMTPAQIRQIAADIGVPIEKQFQRMQDVVGEFTDELVRYNSIRARDTRKLLTGDLGERSEQQVRRELDEVREKIHKLTAIAEVRKEYQQRFEAMKKTQLSSRRAPVELDPLPEPADGVLPEIKYGTVQDLDEAFQEFADSAGINNPRMFSSVYLDYQRSLKMISDRVLGQDLGNSTMQYFLQEGLVRHRRHRNFRYSAGVFTSAMINHSTDKNVRLDLSDLPPCDFMGSFLESEGNDVVLGGRFRDYAGYGSKEGSILFQGDVRDFFAAHLRGANEAVSGNARDNVAEAAEAGSVHIGGRASSVSVNRAANVKVTLG